MHNKRSYIDEFIALPDEEKERIVAEYDKPFAVDRFKPLTPAQRRKWNTLQAAMKAEHRKAVGRPKKGAGAKIISLSVEKALLKRADAAAKQNGMTRAQLVAQGLEMALSKLAS